MRGDVISDTAVDYEETIDVYLHTCYDDIEDIYRENVFKLGIAPY
jgi:integrase/recombinase XerD